MKDVLASGALDVESLGASTLEEPRLDVAAWVWFLLFCDVCPGVVFLNIVVPASVDRNVSAITSHVD